MPHSSAQGIAGHINAVPVAGITLAERTTAMNEQERQEYARVTVNAFAWLAFVAIFFGVIIWGMASASTA